MKKKATILSKQQGKREESLGRLTYVPINFPCADTERKVATNTTITTTTLFI